MQSGSAHQPNCARHDRGKRYAAFSPACVCTKVVADMQGAVGVDLSLNVMSLKQVFAPPRVLSLLTDRLPVGR